MLVAALPGVFALAEVFLGGWISHFLSLRREREGRRYIADKESRDLLRSRREELYTLVTKWAMKIATNNLTFSSVMQGKLDYDQANDLMIKDAEGSSFDFERIEMLIGAYCPTTLPAYSSCLEARSQINSVFGAFKRQYEAEGPFHPYPQLSAYVAAGIEFDRRAEEFKKVIVDEVRQLNQTQRQ